MRSLDPGQILADLVDRDVADQTGCVPVPVGEIAQTSGSSLLNPCTFVPLPRVPVMEVANQISAKDSGVGNRVPLAVCEEDTGGRIARELRDTIRVAVVLKIPPPENRVLPVTIDGIVELRGVGIPVEWGGGVENETGRIERVACGRAVGKRIRL